MMSMCDMVPALEYANATFLKAGIPIEVCLRKCGQHQRFQTASRETEFREVVEFFLQAIVATRENDETHMLTNAQLWDTTKSLNGQFKVKPTAKETV